jgi:hypothetical protein
MKQLTKWAALPVALLLFSVMLTAPAAAQTTASIDATAVVQNGYDPITTRTDQALDFGTVDAGLGPYDAVEANFGRVYITGEASVPVNIEYTTLPGVLVIDDGSGATIPITFETDDGIQWTTGYPGAFTRFNPLITQTLAFTGSSDLTVGIDGTISPPLTATDGTYDGTIVLTVWYP